MVAVGLAWSAGSPVPVWATLGISGASLGLGFRVLGCQGSGFSVDMALGFWAFWFQCFVGCEVGGFILGFWRFGGVIFSVSGSLQALIVIRNLSTEPPGLSLQNFKHPGGAPPKPAAAVMSPSLLAPKTQTKCPV